MHTLNCEHCTRLQHEVDRLEAEVSRLHATWPKINLVPLTILGLYLDSNAPRSAFMLGATLSGGDMKQAAAYLTPPD